MSQEANPAYPDDVFEDEGADSLQEYLVAEQQAGQRIDLFITEQNPAFTRSYVRKLIDKGLLHVDGQVVKASYKLKGGEKVVLQVPAPEVLEVVPEDIPLDIVYEDADLVVVNKPQGMVVHPAAGNYSGTLVNALLYHCQDLSGINGVLRPGIVHRIDKDTSGLLMVAKNDVAHLGLAEQIKNRQVNRRYLTLVHGNLQTDSGTIDAPIGRDPKDRQRMAVIEKNSKHAVTHYQVLQRFGNYTFLQCKLETGRTHQIRVHMAFMGHPVVGDPKYGPRKPQLTDKGQFLHAAVLGFVHPRTQEYMEFDQPLPPNMQKILDQLSK